MEAEYSVRLDVPRNGEPSTGWAVAGIFVFPKGLALIPHFLVLGILIFLVLIVTWFGFIVAAFTGRLPMGIQEFAAGVLQWESRVLSFFYGLTDDYPPFALRAVPNE
jgi:hypothetical protein